MIRVEQLSFKYPGASKPSLQGVNFSVSKGSLFGLIGPNGAGKTTLISLILGILKITDGNITLDQQKSNSRKIPTIGYTPQDYAFYPNLSIIENLDFFAGVQGLKSSSKKQRVEYCLDFCQLSQTARSKASQISGGQKRRLNIAISLLTDPQILIFDEPTVNIDPQSRLFILKQIKALQNQGKTIIYTSHYMEEIEHLCDHVAIMDHGKILISGSIEEVLPSKRLTVSCETDISPSSTVIKDTLHEYTYLINNKQLIFSDVDIKSYFTLVEKIQALDLDIINISYNKYDLESFFIELTNTELRD